MSKPKPPETAPDGRPIWGRDDKGRPICFKTKRDGNPCQARILCANGRCRANGHGGTLKGRPLIHGGRSEALAGLRLAEKYEAEINDPELISHRSNITTLGLLINARLAQASPPYDIWAEAMSLYETAMSAGGENESRVKALRDLGDALRRGVAAELSIREAVSMMDQQRRHKQAESKRETELETTLSARQSHAFGVAVLTAVREEVPDIAAQQRIAERVSRLISSDILRRSD